MSDQAPLNDQNAPASAPASIPPPALEPATEFLITKEHRRFAEFCDACRRDRYIGLCYGPPGVGKSLSARHYAKWGQLEAYQPVKGTTETEFAEIVGSNTVFYTPHVVNSPRRIEQD